MNQRESWGLLAVVLLMFIFMWPGFGDVLQHPNGYLFAESGDGLKNYFNLGYYLKYDVGIHFTGVNYPFGEHLLYVDSHPLFAYLLNLIDNHLFELAPNAVGVINLAILFGMVLCAGILFLILRHYELPIWYATIIALSITFLSPQWDRLHGHLSLSYGFVIPLFWYLLIRHQASAHKIKWWLLIFIYTCVIGGIHMYYVAICALFLLAYILISGFNPPSSRRTWWKKNLALSAAVILPLIFYLSFSALTDIVNDRPISPYGFFDYHATFSSVFLPHYSSATTFLTRLFKLNLSWEGRAFIGIPSLLFLLGMSLYWILRKFKYIHTPELILPPGISQYFFASVLVLFFSMCIPFKWGLQFVPDLITPLKQFRALGRFSWVFYYIVNVMSAVGFYRLFRLLKERQSLVVGDSFLTAVLLSWAFDAGSFYQNHGPVSISNNSSLKNTDEEYLRRFTQSNVDYKNFQAIMSSPLVAIRTDKMTFDEDLTSHNEAFKCAFYTGIPLIQSSASRPSLSQSLTSIQLISSPEIRKERLKSMDQNQPLLLIFTKASNISSQEKFLLSQAQKFWENDIYQFLSLPLSAFDDSLAVRAKSFAQINTQEKPSEALLQCDPHPCKSIFFDSFENEHNAPAVFFGEGARYEPSKELVLFDSVFTILDSTAYEGSFWVFIDPRYSGMPAWEYLSGMSPSTLVSTGWQPTRNLAEIDRQWVRVSFPMTAGPYHKVVLHGKKSTADNLMFRPREQAVYITSDKALLYNNYWLEKTE